VQAVIELDDSSHKGREQEDARRASKLTDAGYRVIRYSQIPNIAEVREAFASTAISEDASPAAVRSVQRASQRHRPSSPL
jgi:very-short-patch-repair endonuclease